jgi:hypothetical protein
MAHSADNDAPEFREVSAEWCEWANSPHVRFRVTWPDGTPDDWCSGRAPRHIGPRMFEQLREARARVTSPEVGDDQ